ncbi:MAG TPA: DUF6569 family protein [Planctomycetota bacterium]|nr:DUF6569 family protein [Planctomycetota bacterium]
MNCREHQEFFSDLYDGNLAPDRRRDLEAHLASCAECRAAYGDLSESLHALREGSSPVPGEPFVRNIVETVRSETERIALFQNTGMRRPTTRRTVSTRRAAWALPAVAAAALIAFAIGFLVQKQAADQEIRDLQEQIARALRETPTPEPPRPVVTNDVIITQWLREKNVVNVDGLWMSTDLQDRLKKGEVLIDGQWVDLKKEIARQVADELAKAAPGAPDPKALEDKILEKHDLVRRGEWILPRKWSEALDKGQVLAAGGEPKDLEDLVGDKIRELGFVKLDGKWMTPEQRTQMLAARKIQKGDGAAAPAALVKALDGLEIGPPLGFRNLMIYPLVAPADRTVAAATLPDALAALEFADEGNALQVRVKNKGDADVVLFAGELLAGGRHDRVVSRDTIVPAKKDRTVDVFDVEPGQLRAADKTAFSKTGGARLAPLGLARLLNDEVGQAGVWVSAVRASPLDLYRDHKAAIAEFRAAFKDLRAPNPNIVGVAVAVGDSIAAIEVFGSPALFASQLDRVLESAALEAIVANDRETRFPSEMAASPLAVRRLAESAFAAEPDAEGDTVVLRHNGRALGRVVSANGEPVRVLLFPDGPESRRSGVDLAVAPPKVSHVVQAYLARLQAPNGSRRSATIREMAMLPGPDAGKAVMAQLNGPQRREAVEALGLRGDPAAAETLLRLLKESRKENPPTMYPLLAQALARLGSEKAAQELIEDLNPKTPVLAKAAADHLPMLLSGMRNGNALEVAMTNAIHALSRLEGGPPDSHGTPWPHRTLIFLTGKNYENKEDYVLWWNSPKDRQEFLDRFAGRR